MADPIKVLNRLDTVSNRYTVFEPDQVLTHGQLNDVVSYLDDQQRLSRVTLAGVGLVGGLRVAVQGGLVRVTAGLGLSTDGDLLMLPADTLYDRFRPYDDSAPVYPPFHPADQPAFAIVELVAQGESDVLALPLAALPAPGLADKVAVLLMESVENDPDQCTGADCDNLGRDALHRQRPLLLRRADAESLLQKERALAPASSRAQALPELTIPRPALGGGITGTSMLNAIFRDAAEAMRADLARQLPALAAAWPEAMQELFGADVSAGWVASLQNQSLVMQRSGNRMQLWHAYLKDLVETWNALREAMFADDSVLLPGFDAFPKHLLLGDLASPRSLRTGLYPSPAAGGTRDALAHAKFLVWKLHHLIGAFAPPTDTALRITPSLAERWPLEDRAIPWYYRIDEGRTLPVAWNYRLAARDQANHNLGYRAAQYQGSPRALAPLAGSLGRHDFFRVEGHLGRPVTEVLSELHQLIAAHNLPFAARAVLLHTVRTPGLVRPDIRYTDLHRLHYLLRRDVALQVEQGQQFGDKFAADMDRAVREGTVAASLPGGQSTVAAANSAREAMQGLARETAPLAATRYTTYKAAAPWQATYASALGTVGQSKVTLGNLSRTDFAVPFDGLLATNRPQWIDWLDDLIGQKDQREDDKLLFSRFLADHPGLDHQGGVPRGGTLVLAYDDNNQVVADFALDDFFPEVDEPEPEEPPLPVRPYRPPFVLAEGLRVVKPIEAVLDQRFFSQRAEIDKDWGLQLTAQKSYVDGVFKFVDPKNTDFAITGTDRLTGNKAVDNALKGLSYRQQAVRDAQDLIGQPDLDPASRRLAQGQLEQAQLDLAEAVSSTSQAVIDSGLELAPGTRGAAATGALTAGIAQLNTPAASERVQGQLAGLRAGNAAQEQFVGGLRQVAAGLRR